MVKLILFGLVAFAVYSLFKNKRPLAAEKTEKGIAPVELKMDPVCKTYVEESSQYKVKYYDQMYYFCSRKCMDDFIREKQENPVVDLDAERKAPAGKVDPICKAQVSPSSEFKVKYYDDVYHFCSKKCMDEFIQQKRG